MRQIANILLWAVVLLVVGGSTARQQVEPAPVQESQPRFAWVDAWIDSHGQPLAAYQFELKSSGGGVTLIGVEGGEHPAFTPPPYYDPKANLQNRIVIAGFNTGDDLPRGRTRVARVMVRVTGKASYTATLQVAASSEAKPIDASISVSEGAAQ